MIDEPFESAAAQLNATLPLSTDAEKLGGGNGTPAGVAVMLAGRPTPTPFVARTSNS